MFIHFAPNTWTGLGQDDLSLPLDRINPKKLGTDQWCKVAKSWGAEMIVFVAKLSGGFCWWQTNTTEYSAKKFHGEMVRASDWNSITRGYPRKVNQLLEGEVFVRRMSA